MKKTLVLLFACLWLSTSLFVWLYPKQESSNEERRKLNQFPELSLDTIIDGTFSNKFESYTQDQFPYRFQMRQAKAQFRYYGLGIFENNDYYIDGQKIMKIEYPLKESEILKAKDKFETIKTMYFKDNDVYVSIIPDKSYYSQKQTIPTIDYEQMENLLLTDSNFEYIDIKDLLSKNDFYNTDIHWKQENIETVASTLLESMDKQVPEYTIKNTDTDFTGVYYGHSALLTSKDQINYIDYPALEEASVKLLDRDGLSVYDQQALSNRDQYDFFLYGPQAIVEIENKNATSEDEIIIFRDSFGSSLAPYFIDSYQKVTLIDIRYISSSVLDDYIDFNNQDVLFIYSGTVLNTSSMFK